MRHGVAHRKLNRTSTHRRAMFANMAARIRLIANMHVGFDLREIDPENDFVSHAPRNHVREQEAIINQVMDYA